MGSISLETNNLCLCTNVRTSAQKEKCLSIVPGFFTKHQLITHVTLV